MKINKILLTTGIVLLLLASCTTDEVQPETRKVFPNVEGDEVLVKMDSASCNVTTIMHDTILCGAETDPPPIRPTK